MGKYLKLSELSSRIDAYVNRSKEKTLDIEPLPFQFRYAERMTACFDLADPEMPVWAEEI